MSDYRIVTDTAADLPASYLKEHNIGLMHLRYIVDGKTYGKDEFLDDHEFYEMMRAGKMPTTSQVNIEDALEVYEESIKETKKILCLSFASGLSGSYNSARIAAEDMMEKNPELQIVVLDTQCASLGQGLLVYLCVKQMESGRSFEEVCEYAKNMALNIVTIVTVDDLFHLYRGGRVSRTSAVIGSMVNIKPIIHLNYDGKLIPIHKVRGRKKSLLTLVDYMEKHIGKFKGQYKEVFVSHADCEEDARFVLEEVKKRLGLDEQMINFIGPTIGAHTGPGAVALFIVGEEK